MLFSKGQSIASQRERLTFLRAQGTRCTLLIDPEAQTVEVHDGERTARVSGDNEVRRRRGSRSASPSCGRSEAADEATRAKSPCHLAVSHER